MTPENFTYWLQGFFEISDAKELDETQVQIIKDHLNLVFNKVTPNRKPELSFEEGNTSIPFEFDLMPKTYCSTSTTKSVDLSSLNKKVC